MDQQNQQPMQPTPGSNQDIEKNKVFAIIGYIIPILFFIPLVTDGKNSAYAKFHANQQLNLLLFCAVGYVASIILMVILIGYLVYILVMVMFVVCMILGILTAAKGEMKPLPLIGGFTLIK